MRTHSHNERGFTLAELIIAIAILGILFAFFVTAMGQTLIITAKVQTRDKALAIAQDELEKMRNTLIIPDGPVTTEDENWPGYFVTITSTRFLDTTGTSTYVQFLRNVTVTVSGPISAVHLQTNIQTYRPQISFFLPVASVAYIRDKDPVLEGLIRDDGYTITKVEYRTRPGTTGTWGSWATLSSLYLDANRQSAAALPLQVGRTYYFTYPIIGTGNDGTVQEIQVQATNSGNYVNEQPSQPFGGTSYVRLITDKTEPTATVNLIPTTSITIGSTPTLTVMASDATSGVYGVFAVISKTPSGSTTKTYLHEIPQTVPYWASDIYYNTTTASDLQYQFILPTGTLTYVPWTQYSFQAYVIDNVIGKYYDYLKLIPTQTSSPGVDYLWQNVTANFYQTATITRMMHPMPIIVTGTATTITATTATLRGSVNPGGLDSSVWFEYKLTSGAWIATVTTSKNGVAQVDFSAAVNLQPGTQYEFRACVRNDWGTYYGAIVSFTTLALTP